MEDDDRSSRSAGLTPVAAATDLRRILEAGGDGSGILAQQRALIQWGRNLPSAEYLGPAREGGLEHFVWPVGPDVIKITYGGAYGRTVRRLRDGRLALRPATPLEYLARWERHNNLFGDDVRILGVVTDNEGPRLVIAQRALRGSLPSPGVVASFLTVAGWEVLPDHLHAWIARSRGIAIFDARPANFVLVGGTPVPFDLIPVTLESVGL